MITINYGPWVPDLSNNAFLVPDQESPTDVPVADCLNVCYVNGAYRSILPPVSQGSALTGQVVGASTFIDVSGIALPMAGVGSVAGTTAIYYWTGSAWVQMTINPAQFVITTVATNWYFKQFGSQYYGLIVPSQLWLLGTSAGSLYSGAPATTWNLVSGSPLGTVIGIVGQFIMIGDLFGQSTSVTLGTGNGVQVTFSGTLSNIPSFPTSVSIQQGGGSVGSDNGSGVITGAGISSGSINYDTGAVSVTFTAAPGGGVVVSASSAPANRSRLQWSAIGNGQLWPTPLTNAALAVQSGINDLEYAYGPVMFISGYPLYAVIFQRNAITRAQYIGGNVVFNWQTFARNQGLLAKNAAVQVGADTYFLSDAGFFSTDGANVVPIGTTDDNSAGIDGWFFANVNKNAYGAIRAGYDASMRAVCFAIPTGSNTLPDTLLTYNVVARRWCRSAISSEMVWTDSDGTNNRLGLFSQSHQYQLLTGTPSATAYLESTDIGFADGNVRCTVAVRPIVNGTSPSVVIGNRNTLNASISYSASSTPDAFGGGFAGVFGESLYTRIRVSSTNAQAINGAACDMVPGGEV